MSTNPSRRRKNGTFAPLFIADMDEYLRVYLKDRTIATSECWGWSGGIDKDGFASVRAKGYRGTGHRLSYEIVHGAIPPGMVVLQRCENRVCVNPEHLYLATKKDVTRIAALKGHMGNTGLPVRDRIMQKVSVSASGCWEWQGKKAGLGYGTMSVDSKVQYVHRLMWEMENRPIPPGYFILHRCDNPPCCNPDHLFLGTPGDNSRDMAAKGRWRNNNSRLTPELASEIRASFEPNVRAANALAERFGISVSHLYAVVAGEHWTGPVQPKSEVANGD